MSAEIRQGSPTERWQRTVDDFYGPLGAATLPSIVRNPRILGGVLYNTKVNVSRQPELSGMVDTDLEANLAQIGSNLEVVKSGDSTFEITRVVNNPSSSEYMLHVSTYSSAISTNAGNAYELAVLAKLFPEKNIVYCASFGNGGSSPLVSEDRAYVQKTGRFTRDEDGKTLPISSIRNMLSAFSSVGIDVVSLLGSDSAGGSIATALGVAMPEGAMKRGFFSARSNLVALTGLEIAWGMLAKEQFMNAKANQQMSPDALRVTGEKVAFAKAIYDETLTSAARAALKNYAPSTPQKLGALWTSMQGLRRGPDESGIGPLALDTNVLIRQQPEAKLTYVFGERDPLYLNAGIALSSIYTFMRGLKLGRGSVRAHVHPGTHAMNTHFPELYLAFKKSALS